jgi:hypothetical protein
MSGQIRPALRAGDGKSLELARLDQGNGNGDRHGADVDGLRDERLGGGRRAGIGNMHHLDALAQLEQLGREMRKRARARRRVVEAARHRPGARDQLFKRVHVEVRPHREGDREKADLGDRGEILEGVVGHLVVEARIDGE